MAKWESFLPTVAAEIAPIDCATDLAQCLTGIDLAIHRHFRSAKAPNSVVIYRPEPKKLAISPTKKLPSRPRSKPSCDYFGFCDAPMSQEEVTYTMLLAIFDSRPNEHCATKAVVARRQTGWMVSSIVCQPLEFDGCYADIRPAWTIEQSPIAGPFMLLEFAKAAKTTHQRSRRVLAQASAQLSSEWIFRAFAAQRDRHGSYRWWHHASPSQAEQFELNLGPADVADRVA
jgi:hypothetical protein